MLTKTYKNYFDKFFNESFENMFNELFHLPNMGVEFKESEDNTLTVLVDMPGVKEDDVNIELKDDTLYIKGERKTASSSYLISKKFTVPMCEDYDKDSIKAELKDGLLTLSLKKKNSPPKEVKKIKVTTTK